ncbi:ATP-binding protein [Kitasatospora camelliae]|uniref:BTAD domain-containing putative transcriptional regulator n=1 Tax=Kitasatospora camelliae TaxID=3156397 RepID=A0AAU8JSS5_9ACTN
MYYGILGTTTAQQDDGTPVPLGGARLRALLAALVLRQGRPVPADLLVDEVWDADPPQDAAAALQTLVGRLRRTVGRAEIGSGPAGYWLSAAASDLGDFQRLTAEGRRALEGERYAEAAERLDAALALWRGPALADLPDRGGPATRLEAQRDEARRQRLEAGLRLGRAAELLAELIEAAGSRPLDEPVQALLIRALADTGRTAEALQSYERVRRALAEQLGTDPGPELRALHRGLLGPQEPAGGGQAPAAAAPPRPAEAPRPRAAGNLRPRLTSFVGRDSDLAAVRQALKAGRLTTLTGPGGSGKTRLSVEAGRREQAAGSWPDGVWLVELAPLDAPEAVPGAVVTALGLRETVLHTGSTVAEALENRETDPVRRIVEHCARRRMLLVLDNCEHLIAAAAELADQLLVECPQLTVLATSREPLGVPGEAVLPVEPLPEAVALRLLAERGAAARPGFDPAEDPRACAEICRRLDGLPLAIELAAARLRGLTPRQLADRLDSRFALLTAGSRTLLPRQQTLRAVVDWSWDLLGKRERAVLRRLAVFAGGCTLEDAEEVLADGVEVPREEVADLLLSLVDKSLVVADLAGPRYGMLETIHEYAAEQLARAGEEEQVGRRHLIRFRETVRRAELDLHGPRQLNALAVLDREQENVRAALRRAVDTGDEQEALVLVLGLSGYWALRDHRAESRGWYEAVIALGPDPFAEGTEPAVPLEDNPLDAPPPMRPELLADARRQLHLHRLVGLFSGNMAMFGDREAVGLARRVTAAYTPDLPQAYRLPGLLRVFSTFLSGELDQVREVIDDAVTGARRHGRPGDLAFVLQLRARLLNDWVGGLEQAVRDSAEARALFAGLGDRWGMSEALAAQGENATKQGEVDLAVSAYREAIAIAEEFGATQEVPMLKVRLGEVVEDLEPGAGERMIREALASIGEINHATDGALLYGRLVLCNLHVQRGEYRSAFAELDRLMENQELFAPMVPGIFLGIVQCIRAWTTARSGDPERGMELLAEARREIGSVETGATVFADHMSVMLLMPAVGVLVEAARQGGDREAAHRAAVLLGAHDVLHGTTGTRMERRERDYARERLLDLLGAPAFEAAAEEGGRLTVREAAALLDAP